MFRGEACSPAAQTGLPYQDKNMEARSGIEPPIRVLQTLALPFGHRAFACFESHLLPCKFTLVELPDISSDRTANPQNNFVTEMP